MWMKRSHEIGRRIADEECIRPRMRSKIESLKYVSNVKNVEKIIGIKEPMMIRWKN
jgi:hypothetical protein